MYSQCHLHGNLHKCLFILFRLAFKSICVLHILQFVVAYYLLILLTYTLHKCKHIYCTWLRTQSVCVCSFCKCGTNRRVVRQKLAEGVTYILYVQILDSHIYLYKYIHSALLHAYLYSVWQWLTCNSATATIIHALIHSLMTLLVATFFFFFCVKFLFTACGWHFCGSPYVKYVKYANANANCCCSCALFCFWI